MTDRCRCIHCDDWFAPDEFDDVDEDTCEACRDDRPTLQGRIDDEGDRLFREGREDGLL